jgi:threonine/homoserine/homoserine lactone efflux protein
MSAASTNTKRVGQPGRLCQVLHAGAVHRGARVRRHAAPQGRYDLAVALNVWGFAAITVPLVVTPGASTAVVLRNSLAGGVRSGVATAIGVNTGSICYGLLTAFGAAVALQRWPMGWAVLRAGGTAYLAWLGLRSLRLAWTYRGGAPAVTAGTVRPRVWHSLREGFLTNALNPSIATFYLLVVPQFIPRDAPIVASALLLTAFHVSLALTWHLTWAAAGGSLSATLNRTRPRRLLEAVSGVALLGLALKLALRR